MRLLLVQGHSLHWKRAKCCFAWFKDTIFFEKASSPASLGWRTPSSLEKRQVALCLVQGHCLLCKSVKWGFAWFNDTVFIESAPSASSLGSRTPFSLKRHQVPLRLVQGHRHLYCFNPLKCKEMPYIDRMCVWLHFTCTCAPQISLIWMKI